MPEKSIRVRVYRFKDRKTYSCEWTDPETGKLRRRSAGTKIKREAERFAAKLESELNDPRAKLNPRTTWEDFKDRVERDFLPDKRPSTRERYLATLNVFERAIKPKLLTGIRAAEIGQFKGACREAGNTDQTVAAHLRHLKSLLRWAKTQGLVAVIPAIVIPQGEATSRGKALDDADFNRLVEAVPMVVGESRAASWVYLLRGLYLSGLRIGEALSLTWGDAEAIHVDLSGPTKLLVIPGRMQKGRKDTQTPLTPDFVEFLEATPENDRRGFVFNPAPLPRKNRTPERLSQFQVEKTIIAIGKTSKIETKRGQHPTAHDLRRSFCTRWARVLLPQHLMRLARHASIQTTLQYYADVGARETAEAIAAALTTKTSTTTSE